MLTLHLFNGRINIDGSNPGLDRTTADGTLIDDWGFDGPKLEGVIGVHSIYGNIQFVFDNDVNLAIAARATGWKIGNDEDMLEMQVDEDRGDLVKILSPEGREEFFGDWDLTSTSDGLHIPQG
jgi:hypothetical protein